MKKSYDKFSLTNMLIALLTNILAATLAILTLIILFPLFTVISITEKFTNIISIAIVQLSLRELIKEYKFLYNRNLIHDRSIIVFTNNIDICLDIPSSISETFKTISKARKMLGDPTIHKYNSYKLDCDIFLNIKKQYNCVSFFPLKNNKFFLKHAHLYNIKRIDETELSSLLSLNISQQQKSIILESYNRKIS